MDLKIFRPMWDLEKFLPLPPRADGLENFPASVGLTKFPTSTTTRRRTCKIFGLCGTYNISCLYHHAPMDLKNFRPLWDLENFPRLLPRAEGLVKFSASVGLTIFLASTTTRRWT